jgi:hypothetical protein
MRAAGRFAARVTAAAPGDPARIEQAYEILFSRPPTSAEVQLGLEFLRNGKWPQYAQALLGSGAFYYVN